MSELFNVVFRGDILPGHTLPAVKAQVAQLFKLDDARLAAVFSGKPVVLKKDCDAATAEKFKAALARVGADSEIRSSAAAQAAPAAIPPPVKAASPAPVATPPATPVAVRPAATPAATPAAASGAIKLAPVGPMLTEAERAAMRKPPVQVRIDHIGLEKRASSFMVADEKPAIAKRPEIKAPDFGVAAVGGDLLKDDEKRVYEELEIDLSAFEVAELGADMLSEDDKVPLPVMEIEELDADLAPVGSDMAQIKKPTPPPPPKTDHLKLI
jgi:hypothetical protein